MQFIDSSRILLQIAMPYR